MSDEEVDALLPQMGKLQHAVRVGEDPVTTTRELLALATAYVDFYDGLYSASFVAADPVGQRHLKTQLHEMIVENMLNWGAAELVGNARSLGLQRAFEAFTLVQQWARGYEHLRATE